MTQTAASGRMESKKNGNRLLERELLSGAQNHFPQELVFFLQKLPEVPAADSLRVILGGTDGQNVFLFPFIVDLLEIVKVDLPGVIRVGNGGRNDQNCNDQGIPDVLLSQNDKRTGE